MWNYKLGAVVKRSAQYEEFFQTDRIWGHITGFSRNAFGETIVIVKWEDGHEGPTHTANITLEGE